MEREGLIGAYVSYFSNEWFGDLNTIQKQTKRTVQEFYDEDKVKMFLRNDIPNTAGTKPHRNVFRRAGPDRSIAWGPACWQAPLSRIADNTMLVLRDEKYPSHLTICVCGTNPLSLFSWIFNDFAVFSPVEWRFCNEDDSMEVCLTESGSIPVMRDDSDGHGADCLSGSTSEIVVDDVLEYKGGLRVEDLVDKDSLTQSMEILAMPETEIAEVGTPQCFPPRFAMPQFMKILGEDLKALTAVAKTNVMSWDSLAEWQKTLFISRGTMIGLTTLLEMRDSETGKTLLDFLRDESIANYRRKRELGSEWEPLSILVTGHSLGGALAPALALCLHDRRCEWDVKKSSAIFCTSFAGPTFGNASITKYYDEVLGDTTLRIANDRDVVTHAWGEFSMAELKGIYCPEIKTPFLINAAVLTANTFIKNVNYAHICSDQEPFVMSVKPGTNDFVTEMCVNHSRTYVEHAHLESLAPLLGKHVPLYNELFCGDPVRMMEKVKQVVSMPFVTQKQAGSFPFKLFGKK